MVCVITTACWLLVLRCVCLFVFDWLFWYVGLFWMVGWLVGLVGYIGLMFNWCLLWIWVVCIYDVLVGFPFANSVVFSLRSFRLLVVNVDFCDLCLVIRCDVAFVWLCIVMDGAGAVSCLFISSCLCVLKLMLVYVVAVCVVGLLDGGWFWGVDCYVVVV